MRILLISANYAPELTGIGKYSGEWAEWLVKAGHEVHVIAAPPYYPEWKIQEGYSAGWYKVETRRGVAVWRCPIWVPGKLSGVKRILHLASFALSTMPVIALHAFWNPGVVIAIEPPLFCAPSAWLCAKWTGAKSWLHVQDLEVDAAFELGLLKSSWLRRIAGGVETWLMRRFDRVSSISENMVARLISKGVKPERTVLFPNWVDTELIYPQQHTGKLRQRWGIAEDAVVALYSGNMGEKQGLEILLEAAKGIEGEGNIKFVMAGAGAARARLQNQYADLTNVIWLPLQQLEDLNDFLSMADIHLLPQRAGIEDLVLPSKLTGMLASGRPVIATVNPYTQIARVLAECGVAVEPENVECLQHAILALAADSVRRTEMGKRARRYAQNYLSRSQIMQAIDLQLHGLK